jgi:hypothetical protein
MKRWRWPWGTVLLVGWFTACLSGGNGSSGAGQAGRGGSGSAGMTGAAGAGTATASGGGGAAGSAGATSPGGAAGTAAGAAGAGGTAGTAGGAGASGAAGGAGTSGAAGATAGSGGAAGAGGTAGRDGGATGDDGGGTGGGGGGTVGDGGGMVGDGGGGQPADGGSPDGGGGTCTASTPGCCPTPDCLLHRYSFDGTGTAVTDSVGTADGILVGTTLAGDGTVVLAGGAQAPYVELPTHLISGIGDSATIEVWVTWTDTADGPWQRILDFGSSDAGDGSQGNGVEYLFVTPENSHNQSLRCAFSLNGLAGETVIDDLGGALPAAAMAHLAVVFNGVTHTMALYRDGTLVAQVAMPVTDVLSALDDVNVWLGRSQYAADPGLGGTFTELRLYGVARTDAQIAASQAAGPDALP